MAETKQMPSLTMKTKWNLSSVDLDLHTLSSWHHQQQQQQRWWTNGVMNLIGCRRSLLAHCFPSLMTTYILSWLQANSLYYSYHTYNTIYHQLYLSPPFLFACTRMWLFFNFDFNFLLKNANGGSSGVSIEGRAEHGFGGNLAIYYACFPCYLKTPRPWVHRVEFLLPCIQAWATRVGEAGFSKTTLFHSCSSSDSEIMRSICCKFWQFNCWTFWV